MATNDSEQRIARLEDKVAELDAMVNLALRLLALERPVSSLLERYGATEAEVRAVHAILDDVATRAERSGMYTPSFGAFEQELFERFPSIRGNREFVLLLLDTLKLDRPAYQKLHSYINAQRWPQQT